MKEFCGQLYNKEQSLEISQSLYRCKEIGLNPDIQTIPRCNPEDIATIKKKTIKTFAYSNRVINSVIKVNHDPYLGYAIFSEDGWLLRLYGAPEFLHWAEKRGIKEFSNWLEENAGTNAVSLGIKYGQSFELFGRQNYCKFLQDTAIYFTPYMLDRGEGFQNHKVECLGGIAIITPLREKSEGFLMTTIAIAKEVCLHLNLVDDFYDFYILESAGHISIDIDINKQSYNILYHSSNIFDVLGIPHHPLNFVHAETVFDLPPKNIEFWNIIKRGIVVNNYLITLSIQGNENHYIIRTLPYKQYMVGYKGVHIFIESVNKKNQSLSKEVVNDEPITFNNIVGESQAMLDAIHIAKTVANSDMTVLILGESGVGKDIFARAIHNTSKRRDKPFVALNCAAIPRDLISSELFGYVEGAFTGARRGGNIGKFEMADTGTIFLDEIGDMPLELQAVLLDVLENKSIMRIGSNVRKQVDIRVIAATNADLLSKIAAKSFREDLYYRLSAIQFKVPPLRMRGDDIVLLAEHFINIHFTQKGSRQKPILSTGAKRELCSMPWKGNVRELRNFIISLAELCNQRIIYPEHIKRHKKIMKYPNVEPGYPPIRDYSGINNKQIPQSNDATEKRLFEVLAQNKYNKTATATQLGISRRTLYRWLERYDL